jgi:hypothetical protein
MAAMRRFLAIVAPILFVSSGCVTPDPMDVHSSIELPSLDTPGFVIDAPHPHFATVGSSSPDVTFSIDAPDEPQANTIHCAVYHEPPRKFEIFATARQERSIYADWLRWQTDREDPALAILDGSWIRDDVPTPHRITSP